MQKRGLFKYFWPKKEKKSNFVACQCFVQTLNNFLDQTAREQFCQVLKILHSLRAQNTVDFGRIVFFPLVHLIVKEIPTEWCLTVCLKRHIQCRCQLSEELHTFLLVIVELPQLCAVEIQLLCALLETKPGMHFRSCALNYSLHGPVWPKLIVF